MVNRNYRYYQILLVLSFSFLALGLIGFFWIRAMDREYSAIVDNSVTPLADIIRIEANSLRIRQIVALRSTTAHGSDEFLALQSEMHKLSEANDKLLGGLRDACEKLGATQKFEETLAARRQAIDRMHASARARQAGAAEDTVIALRRATVDGYSAYLDKQLDLAKTLEDRVESANDDLTARTNRVTLLFIVIGVWPVLVGLGVFLFALISTVRLFLKARKAATSQ